MRNTIESIEKTAITVDLYDGSKINFPDGFTTHADTIEGLGTKYDSIQREKGTATYKVPLDHIVGLGYYKKGRRKSLSFDVKCPSKAHLYDGSVIVFPEGFAPRGNGIEGIGTKYNVLRHPTETSTFAIPFDQIVTLEYYKKEWGLFSTLVAIPVVVANAFIILLVAFGPKD